VVQGVWDEETRAAAERRRRGGRERAGEGEDERLVVRVDRPRRRRRFDRVGVVLVASRRHRDGGVAEGVARSGVPGDTSSRGQVSVSRTGHKSCSPIARFQHLIASLFNCPVNFFCVEWP